MALELGSKLRALWKLQPWYLWAAEGLAVGTIGYIAYTNRAASAGSTAATTDSVSAPPPDPTTPPGEAPAPGSSAGDSPPAPIQPLPPSPIQPIMPPSPLQPPSAGPGGIINPGTPLKGLRGAATTPGTGGGGKSSLLAHAFADVHVPSEWHENHQQLSGGSNLLPFHTAGEY